MSSDPIEYLSNVDVQLPGIIKAVGRYSIKVQKVEYLKDLSARIEDRRLNLDILPSMEDEEVICILQHVKGIGRWTAEMFLIFCLGRQDIIQDVLMP